MSTNIQIELSREAWVDVNTHAAGVITFYHLCPSTLANKAFNAAPNGTSCTSCGYTMEAAEVQDLLSEAIARIGAWPP